MAQKYYSELIFWIMNPPPSQDMPIWGGTDQKVYDAFGLTKDQYWEEVKFTEETLQVKTNLHSSVLVQLFGLRIILIRIPKRQFFVTMIFTLEML